MTHEIKKSISKQKQEIIFFRKTEKINIQNFRTEKKYQRDLNEANEDFIRMTIYSIFHIANFSKLTTFLPFLKVDFI